MKDEDIDNFVGLFPSNHMKGGWGGGGGGGGHTGEYT